MGHDSVPYVRLVDESFQERQKTSREWKQIRRQRLINSLNRINFQDGEIFLNFKHPQYNYTLSLPVLPQPCTDENLKCIWGALIKYKTKIKDFEFKSFHFTDGLKQILVEAEMLDINKDGVKLSLPEVCDEIRTRKVKRYHSKDVSVLLSQDGILLKGYLTSFSAVSFSVHIPQDSPGFHHDFNRDDHVNVVLMKGRVPLYSGICEIHRISNNPDDGNVIILKPIKSKFQRFKSKKNRSIRQRLLPSPNIIFRHPLTDKIVNLKVFDISGSGFSVDEEIENSVLIPGMVLPDLSIELMSGVELKCEAQAIYRTIEEEGKVKCGIAYLDMGIQDQIKLSSLLQQAKNHYTYLCPTNIDLDALWDFFFEAGFVYPEKYSFIQEQKKKFKKLYQKLYNQRSDISRHVIYQNRGKIYAHVSMLRYYQRTWIMHHHAAIKSIKHKAGLIVMWHILQYINEVHNIPSNKMSYICCYFRPKNRFANRVFGGAAKALKDSQKCSLDSFAYYHQKLSKDRFFLPKKWEINETTENELEIFKHHYDTTSGGLLIEGLELNEKSRRNDENLNEEFKKIGFLRSRYFFSLQSSNDLKAIIVVNRAEAGLNMSDLTNCIQIFVIDTENVTEKIISSALISLFNYYENNDVPILIHPSSFAKAKNIAFEKIYELTILDLQYISPYLEFMRSFAEPSSKKNKISSSRKRFIN